MLQETSTGFTPMIDCPTADGFLLAKDANGTVFVRSDCIGIGQGISAPYDIAVAMGVLFGFGFRDKKTVIIEVPVSPSLMKWLKSSHIMGLVQSLA